MTGLEAACKYLGWQGGTVHDARAELTRREDRLIRMFNEMDEETDMQVARNVEIEIAAVQVLLMGLVESCNQCGKRRESWQDPQDNRCPMHAVHEPYSSCDGTLTVE